MRRLAASLAVLALALGAAALLRGPAHGTPGAAAPPPAPVDDHASLLGPFGVVVAKRAGETRFALTLA